VAPFSKERPTVKNVVSEAATVAPYTSQFLATEEDVPLGQIAIRYVADVPAWLHTAIVEITAEDAPEGV
jgi:hypothetical protein